MEDFLLKYNESQDEDTFQEKFIGDPNLLPLPDRQELEYRYQVLDETVPQLAERFRLTVHALQLYIDDNKLKPRKLTTDEEFTELEEFLKQELDKQRVKVAGLAIYQSIKAWYTLLQNENTLLASAKRSIEALSQELIPDTKTLSQLASVQDKLFSKQQGLLNILNIFDKESSSNLSDIIASALQRIDGDGYSLPNSK